MKFKSLFLGMLGAAALVSCNNNEIDPNPGPNPGDVVEGLPIYATMSINAGNSKTSTYAGTSDVTASLRETQVNDVAMYIYKADASGFVPQCAVYLASIPSTNLVTMRTTSGTKKIFVAANVATNPASTAMTTTTGFNAVSSDMPLSFLLNDTLYSTGAAFGKGSFATPAKTKADGLILNFAMGDIYGTGDGTYSNASARALMTNWDGPVDDWDGGGSIFDGNCTFPLQPDVDSTASETDANNHLDIYVQRQYAKVSLKFSSTIPKTGSIAITTPTDLSSQAFAAATGQPNEGRFIPWGSATNMYWSLGNIPTAQVPFQQFDSNDGTSVRDVFYKLTNDSLSNAAHFNTWTQHYDNTRVFPMATMTSYPMPGLTVSAVKTNMTTTASNRTIMTAETATNPASNDYKYAYTLENARQHPVLKDHQTYVIVGGFYQPQSVTTDITRKAVIGNGTEPNTVATGFTWVPTPGADTLFYHSVDRVFLSGRTTLLAYYAWVKGHQIGAGGASSVPLPASTLTAADFNSDVTDAIKADMDAKSLFSYYEGQCWYRIYLQNEKATTAKKVIVARNHVYDVTISSIKGPGIADPNEIIKPGEPVLELDTYVSATINVLNWHRVEQGVDVDSN